MNKSVYLITGPSGAGKTAVSEHLTAQGYQSIEADSTPGICYFVNKAGKPVPYPVDANAAWWENHSYLWELSRLQRLVDSLESTGKPILICGNAANINKAWPMFTAAFYLDIPSEVMLKRIADGGSDNSFGKRVMERDQLMRWVEPFKAEMLELGAITIDATRPVETVANDILAHIKNPEQATA
jgi:gluconate kinase